MVFGGGESGFNGRQDKGDETEIVQICERKHRCPSEEM